MNSRIELDCRGVRLAVAEAEPTQVRERARQAESEAARLRARAEWAEGELDRRRARHASAPLAALVAGGLSGAVLLALAVMPWAPPPLVPVAAALLATASAIEIVRG